MTKKSTTKGQEKRNELFMKNKELLKLAAPNILISFIILVIIAVFRTDFFTTLFIILIIQVIFYVFKCLKNSLRFKLKILMKGMLITCAYLFAIYVILSFFGGLLGSVIVVVLICALKLFQNWKFFKELLNTLEIAIFGKPLKKQYWKNGKRPRLKLVWRRSK